ncbi:unnamed protein product, partial [Rangifer tarandus platyrhynchus]
RGSHTQDPTRSDHWAVSARSRPLRDSLRAFKKKRREKEKRKRRRPCRLVRPTQPPEETRAKPRDPQNSPGEGWGAGR